MGSRDIATMTEDGAAVFARLRDDGALTSTRLILDDVDMPFEEYEELGAMLGSLGRSVRWWVGDWLTFGAGVYGERFAQAVHATGLAEGTLMHYQSICERVTPSRRRPDVSFSAHGAVADLPPKEQRKWLAVAAREQLSRTELRRRINFDLNEQAEQAALEVGQQDDGRRSSNAGSGEGQPSSSGTSGREASAVLPADVPPLADAARRVVQNASRARSGGFIVCHEDMETLRLAIEEVDE